MSKLEGIADPKYVNKQYQNASNLNVRIMLHQRYSTNKIGWFHWVIDQFRLPPHCYILELGCGPGDLWLENLDRIPAGWEIVLSDNSEGMLRTALGNLGGNRNVQFCGMDAQSIPFESNCFDAVIANHMLYHVPDMASAFGEIRRILKPDGLFYTATFGEQNLKELSALVTKFDSKLASWGARLAGSFTLENGSAQLEQWFARVALHRYDDSLVITEAVPLVDYLLSGRLKLAPDRQSDFAQFVNQELKLYDGKFYVTKDSGVFEARGIL
jgi:ubiquinone/menaquinone biosynthesis C-methylase UbiE